MSAPISVVIPTLNSARGLELSLPALFLGVQAGLLRELIISDGGSTDETAKIADAVGANWITGTPSRGGQIRRGCDSALGEWLLILHSDTVLPDLWPEFVLAHMAQGQAGYFDLSFDSRHPMGWITSRWAGLRSRMMGLPYGDQALLIPRSVLDDLGGYPDIPLMEDVAIARALRGQMRPIGGRVRTSAVKYQNRGWLRQGMKNLILLSRFLLRADPMDLYKRYYKSTNL